ncbi:hypothetical protein KBC04_00550 [Candidatus Babeliales bacterium]|nr:hypothetical protein [Candidatus Babeliales bacterium]MBP9843419.1 hypothetical protein [Candidatus Babeliales bacterium]
MKRNLIILLSLFNFVGLSSSEKKTPYFTPEEIASKTTHAERRCVIHSSRLVIAWHKKNEKIEAGRYANELLRIANSKRRVIAWHKKNKKIEADCRARQKNHPE